MSGGKHELVEVTNHPEGGWSGTCSCGRWGFAGAASKGKLKAEFNDHARNPYGGPK